MQNYKDVCGNCEEVWFEIEPSERKKFLRWAKSLGCVWLDGSKINPTEDVKFNHFSIDNKGKLGIVPMATWLSKQPEFKNITRYNFCEFIKGI